MEVVTEVGHMHDNLNTQSLNKNKHKLFLVVFYKAIEMALTLRRKTIHLMAMPLIAGL